MRVPVLIACVLWACSSPARRTEDLREGVTVAPELEPTPSALDAAPPWEADGFRRAQADGDALVAWRALGGEPPKNRHFDLEVWVVRAGAPVRGAELMVRATMPEHGHGMNVEPRAWPQADGSYRVRGMLFHMSGRWELVIHVVESGRFQRATFELDV